jgi:hypothetical protein
VAFRHLEVRTPGRRRAEGEGGSSNSKRPVQRRVLRPAPHGERHPSRAQESQMGAPPRRIEAARAPRRQDSASVCPEQVASCGSLTKARHRLREPAIAARRARLVAHSLLDDAPMLPSKKRRHGGKAGTHPAQQRYRPWRPCGSRKSAAPDQEPAGRTVHGFRQGFYVMWRPYPPGSKRQAHVRCHAGLLWVRRSRSVVTPLECQSNPRTQPNAWNQNGSERRRSISSGPRSATMCVAISRASCVIRVKSQAGQRPECSGNERSQFDGACKQLRNFAVE